jgi:hypothetical protein
MSQKTVDQLNCTCIETEPSGLCLLNWGSDLDGIRCVERGGRVRCAKLKSNYEIHSKHIAVEKSLGIKQKGQAVDEISEALSRGGPGFSGLLREFLGARAGDGLQQD